MARAIGPPARTGASAGKGTATALRSGLGRPRPDGPFIPPAHRSATHPPARGCSPGRARRRAQARPWHRRRGRTGGQPWPGTTRRGRAARSRSTRRGWAGRPAMAPCWCALPPPERVLRQHAAVPPLTRARSGADAVGGGAAAVGGSGRCVPGWGGRTRTALRRPLSTALLRRRARPHVPV